MLPTAGAVDVVSLQVQVADWTVLWDW